MTKLSPLLLLSALTGAALTPLRAADAPAGAQGKPITEVAHFDKYQVTGIAVSKTGRLFANFPHWEGDYKDAVVEVMPDGTTKPFPNEEWNSYQDGDKDTAGKWVCVQSVVVDDKDRLWVLDPGNINMKGVVAGAPKLVQIDLTTNQVVQNIPFGSDIAPDKSYLNDVRFDNSKEFAYITESGLGGIIVVNLKTGASRRLLVEDESTVADKNVDLTINGKEVLDEKGKKPNFNADGIALSPDGETLYYQSILSETLYKIATAKLRDESLSKNDLHNAVEIAGKTFPVDGLWMDKSGTLYLSDLRGGTIKKRTPDGQIELVAQDPRIQWPDSFAMGPDGALYFSCSHIHHQPKYNGGQNARTEPYTIFKVMP